VQWVWDKSHHRTRFQCSCMLGEPSEQNGEKVRRLASAVLVCTEAVLARCPYLFGYAEQTRGKEEETVQWGSWHALWEVEVVDTTHDVLAEEAVVVEDGCMRVPPPWVQISAPDLVPEVKSAQWSGGTSRW
jgi:hypothetical protein